MFLKQKLHPDGTPDKCKARLVAGGDQQDNIGGAYLNADMDTGVLAHMRLDATVSSLLVKPVQAYGKYLDDRGCIVV